MTNVFRINVYFKCQTADTLKFLILTYTCKRHQRKHTDTYIIRYEDKVGITSRRDWEWKGESTHKLAEIYILQLKREFFFNCFHLKVVDSTIRSSEGASDRIKPAAYVGHDVIEGYNALGQSAYRTTSVGDVESYLLFQRICTR